MKRRDVERHPPLIQGRFQERVHDPYKTRFKLHEPTVCPDCGAFYHRGRWTWPKIPVPADAARERCQACHRIHDKYPAGWVRLSGDFVRPHRDELVHLARHNETLEKADHPLHRIMEIQEEDTELLITTTDIHLPRRIGEAMRHAYHGELEFHYEPETYRLRVHWVRNERDK